MKFLRGVLIIFVALIIVSPLSSQIEESETGLDDTKQATTDTDTSLDKPTTQPDTELADEPKVNPEVNKSEPQTISGNQRSVSYYTYIGSIVSAGLNSITYNGWVNDKHSSVEESGYYVFPAVCAIIIAPPFMGQFNIGFAYNSNDSELTSISHLKADARIKYMYKNNLPITLTGGAGFFIELPPATEKYDGGGALITLGLLHPLSSDWSLLCDFDLGYGYFGKGSDGRKLTYGVTIGAATKMGNL